MHSSCPQGLARIAQIADTAHIGGEDGHAYHPPRQAPACRRELVGRSRLVEERTPEEHYPTGEQQKYDDIYQMHSVANPRNSTNTTEL